MQLFVLILLCFSCSFKGRRVLSLRPPCTAQWISSCLGGMWQTFDGALVGAVLLSLWIERPFHRGGWRPSETTDTYITVYNSSKSTARLPDRQTDRKKERICNLRPRLPVSFLEISILLLRPSNYFSLQMVPFLCSYFYMAVLYNSYFSDLDAHWFFHYSHQSVLTWERQYIDSFKSFSKLIPVLNMAK
jgi:hypothetical protein